MKAKHYSVVFLIFFIAIPYITLPILFIYGSYYYFRNRDTSDTEDLTIYYESKPNRRFIPREEYVHYLDTEEWKELRNFRLIIDNYTCQQCSNKLYTWQANCHHLHYQTLKEEDIEDIITLCSSCHKKIHKHHGKNAKFYPLLTKQQLDAISS